MNSIKQNVLPQLQGFDFENNMIYKVPVGDILSGFYIEKTTTAYYVWLYFQPLILKADGINFTFSHRLRDSKGSSQFFFDRFVDQDWKQFVGILKDNIALIESVQDIEVFYKYFKKKATSFNMKLGLAFIEAYLNLDGADRNLKEAQLMLGSDIEWKLELKTTIELMLISTLEKRREMFLDWKLKNIKKIAPLLR